jgi:excisionase family DNA binding protein
MTAATRTEAVPKLLLTPEEAAQALGIGRTKLYGLLRSGHLPSVLVGGSRRVPMTSLKLFIDQLSDRSREA